VAVGRAAGSSTPTARGAVAPNVAWRYEPPCDKVEAEVGVPVVVENDVNAGRMGRVRFGAGADVNDLLMVALGTGVGGGIVVGGQLMRGSFGLAAEIGHLRVVPQGPLCGCGRHGCWKVRQWTRSYARQGRVWKGTR
jgi:glucokinase